LLVRTAMPHYRATTPSVYLVHPTSTVLSGRWCTAIRRSVPPSTRPVRCCQPIGEVLPRDRSSAPTPVVQCCQATGPVRPRDRSSALRWSVYRCQMIGTGGETFGAVLSDFWW